MSAEARVTARLAMSLDGYIASPFLKASAVDELFVGLVPVLLEAGRRLFVGDYPSQDLTLAEYSITEGKVRLKYGRRPG